jgi:hypothetical protein
MSEVSTELQLRAEDLDVLRHTVGASERKKRDWGYRNHFCCEVGGEHEKQFASLAERGLARRGHTINEGRDVYYFATESGCRAAGLNKKQTARALGD